MVELSGTCSICWKDFTAQYTKGTKVRFCCSEDCRKARIRQKQIERIEKRRAAGLPVHANPAPKKAEKKPRKQKIKPVTISDICRKAAAEGLSYGQFCAKYGV